jgi:hypothetical protein
MNMHRTIAALGLLLPLGAQANVITFPVGTVISQTYGTGGTVASEYVVIDGWKFEAGGNTLTIFGGGLYDGGAFGIASDMLITRVDGAEFSVESLTLEGHAGYACYQNFCGYDSVTLAGYAPGAAIPTWESFALNGYLHTDTSHDVLNAAFGNLDKLWIDENESFILKSITLNVVPTIPVPAPVWLMGSGLVALYGRFGRLHRRSERA